MTDLLVLMSVVVGVVIAWTAGRSSRPPLVLLPLLAVQCLMVAGSVSSDVARLPALVFFLAGSAWVLWRRGTLT